MPSDTRDARSLQRTLGYLLAHPLSYRFVHHTTIPSPLAWRVVTGTSSPIVIGSPFSPLTPMKPFATGIHPYIRRCCRRHDPATGRDSPSIDGSSLRIHTHTENDDLSRCIDPSRSGPRTGLGCMLGSFTSHTSLLIAHATRGYLMVLGSLLSLILSPCPSLRAWPSVCSFHTY
jgi:hypothetical protein